MDVGSQAAAASVRRVVLAAVAVAVAGAAFAWGANGRIDPAEVTSAAAGAARGAAATGGEPTAGGVGVASGRGTGAPGGRVVALSGGVGAGAGGAAPAPGAGPVAPPEPASPGAPGPGAGAVGKRGPGAGSARAGRAAATAPATAPPPGAYTFVMTNADGSPVRFDPCTPIHYVVNLDGAPTGAAGLVAGAVARLSAATGMTFVDDGPTTEQPSRERTADQPARYGHRWAPVLIAWSAPAESDLLPGGRVVGEGISTWVRMDDGRQAFTSGEAVIDRDDTAQLPATFGTGATLGELLLHELGHVVGLGHSTDQTQVMYPTLLPLPQAAYGAGDLVGLAQLGAPAGCLSVPQP